MEKFGLFNLLSALSSLTAQNGSNENASGDQTPQNTQAKAEKPQTNTERTAGIFTAEERAGRAAEILERHERISRNIDRKNNR